MLIDPTDIPSNGKYDFGYASLPILIYTLNWSEIHLTQKLLKNICMNHESSERSFFALNKNMEHSVESGYAYTGTSVCIQGR